MPAKIETQIRKLRRQVAEAQAKLDTMKARLTRLEAKWKGDTPPVTGLDLLWEAALPKSRERSSKQQCRVAWNRIPEAQRPSVQILVDALRKWNRCEEWSKDGGIFAPGLHRYINERKWESVPEVRDPLAAFRSRPKPRPAGEPVGEIIEDPKEAASLLDDWLQDSSES